MTAVALSLLALAGLVIGGVGAPARRLPTRAAPTSAPGFGPWSTTRWRAIAVRLGRSRRRLRRDAQLPDALERLAAGLRAGQTPGPALVALAEVAPDPLGAELQSVARRLRHGDPLPMALADWARGPDTSDEVRLVAAVLTLGASAGGQVARAVDGVAATLRERRELAGEVNSLATQARASAAVLAAAPIAFTALVATIEPAVVVFLFTTTVGFGCLILGGGLLAVGAAWMHRIVRVAG